MDHVNNKFTYGLIVTSVVLLYPVVKVGLINENKKLLQIGLHDTIELPSVKSYNKLAHTKNMNSISLMIRRK